MKTSQVGAQLFYVDRWTVNQSDRQTESNFVNAPKNDTLIKKKSFM